MSAGTADLLLGTSKLFAKATPSSRGNSQSTEAAAAVAGHLQKGLAELEQGLNGILANCANLLQPQYAASGNLFNHAMSCTIIEELQGSTEAAEGHSNSSNCSTSETFKLSQTQLALPCSQLAPICNSNSNSSSSSRCLVAPACSSCSHPEHLSALAEECMSFSSSCYHMVGQLLAYPAVAERALKEMEAAEHAKTALIQSAALQPPGEGIQQNVRVRWWRVVLQCLRGSKVTVGKLIKAQWMLRSGLLCGGGVITIWCLARRWQTSGECVVRFIVSHCNNVPFLLKLHSLLDKNVSKPSNWYQVATKNS